MGCWAGDEIACLTAVLKGTVVIEKGDAAPDDQSSP